MSASLPFWISWTGLALLSFLLFFLFFSLIFTLVVGWGMLTPCRLPVNWGLPFFSFFDKITIKKLISWFFFLNLIEIIKMLINPREREIESGSLDERNMSLPHIFVRMN